MIKKITLSRYRVNPVGFKQCMMACFFWVTGSITCHGDGLLTEDPKLQKWFK